MPQTECSFILLHNLCETMGLEKCRVFIADIYSEYIAPVKDYFNEGAAD